VAFIAKKQGKGVRNLFWKRFLTPFPSFSLSIKIISLFRFSPQSENERVQITMQPKTIKSRKSLGCSAVPTLVDRVGGHGYRVDYPSPLTRFHACLGGITQKRDAAPSKAVLFEMSCVRCVPLLAYKGNINSEFTRAGIIHP
jgi:hypothetical protein